jgi:hypothetical protein
MNKLKTILRVPFFSFTDLACSLTNQDSESVCVCVCARARTVDVLCRTRATREVKWARLEEQRVSDREGLSLSLVALTMLHTPASYSGVPDFKSRPWHRLS